MAEIYDNGMLIHSFAAKDERQSNAGGKFCRLKNHDNYVVCEHQRTILLVG